MNIQISNLKNSISDQDLHKLFSPFGDVQSASIENDVFTGKSRGFGFVSMPDEDSARKAINELNHTVVEGLEVTVNEAVPKPVHRGSYKVGNGPTSVYKFRRK